MWKVSRKSAEVRRLEITDAILRIVGRNGAAGLTATAIAEEVGLTSGALFRHFASIDAMLVATAQRAAELVQTSFPATELLGKSRLEALVASRVALLREWPGLVWFLLSDQAAARIPEGARAGLLELAHKTQHELTTALLAAREAGELRADVAVEAQRTVLLGVVHALARGSGGDPTEILTGVFQLLVPAPNTALPAITTEPPPSS